MSRSLASSSLPRLISESQNAASLLKLLDIAKTVHVTIEPVNTTATSGPTPVRVILSCSEPKRALIKTGAEVSDGEVSGNVAAQVRNLFGGGESIEFNNKINKETDLSLLSQFSTPINANPFLKLNLIASSSHSNYTLNSGIRSEAGNSLKTSASWTYFYNNLDDNRSFQTGIRFKMFGEMATLGGNSFFSRFLVEKKAELGILDQFSVVTVVRLGALVPLFDSIKNTNVSDRFFLGGPMSIRGFQYRGLGPVDGKDSLGGDLMGMASISLFSRLPFVKSRNLLGQLFANAGSIAVVFSAVASVQYGVPVTQHIEGYVAVRPPPKENGPARPAINNTDQAAVHIDPQWLDHNGFAEH
ncbi:SAM50-like protein [Smittium mucronatum]|uniref:SAM50-like protein n=1 Tax=Smittium mucronatum TaxID=133383 RepID=A0A1R0GXZ8_9FUNG|nr:SAM50-like protein [Smittium mucronatum]